MLASSTCPSRNTRSIPNLQFDLLAIHINSPDLEIYPYCSNKRRRELVFAKPEKET